MDLTKIPFLKFFLAGGLIMWPILICSIWALAIIIEKLFHLRRIKIDAGRFLKGVLEKLKQHKFKDAVTDCDSTFSPVGQILKAGILKYGASRQEVKEAIEGAALYEIPLLERNLSALATIAHVSPLLGLLGTVTGMVRCFQTIQMKATSLRPVNPGDLAGGIWEALLTTVFGLVVAIPAFIAYNYLVARVSGLILEMERAATELVNLVTGADSGSLRPSDTRAEKG